MGKKGDLTRHRIIESATYCLLHFGDRKTTFQLIAEHCKVSQGLVVRHLINRENIFPVVLEHWINWARQKTENTLSKSGTPEEKLRDYLRVSIELFEDPGTFAKIYLLLHYFAGIDEKYRVINSEIKNVAVRRISQIIEDGIKAGIFKDIDVPLIAKTIHSNLVGNVLSAITEIQQPMHLRLSRQLEDACVALLKHDSQA
jgi:AcrR family transcriptional regulator